ncbi:MAG: hypothetical protein ACTHZ5_08290 [Micrococcaceae bacterium]
MAKETRRIPAAIGRIEAARHEPADGRWAWQAVSTMVIEDVAEERIVAALEETADRLAESQESPEELFGSPRRWDREQRARWREEGLVITAPQPLTPRDFGIESLVIASIFSGLFFLYLVLSASWGDTMTLSHLLAPVSLAVACRAMEAAFTRTRRTRSHALGVVGAVVAIALGTAVTVGVFALGNQVALDGNVLLGMLGCVVGYAVLAWSLAQLWPARPTPPYPAAPVGEQEWLDALGAALRARGDVTDARAREIVTEAQSHARESQQPLAAEFGDPAAYADQFSANPQVKRRRKAWLYTGLVGLIGAYNVIALVEGSASWWGAAWLALALLLAVIEWRGVMRGTR